MNPGLSGFLNASRWTAAFLVVFSHARNLILIDYNYLNQKSYFIRIIYFLAGFGHQSVVVFFVLSGYLVGALTLARWKASGVHLGAYAIARISRLYVVLTPALLLGAAIDASGLRWFNASHIYTLPSQYNTVSLVDSMSQSMSILTALGNFLNLQGVLTDTFGTNTPLWSLAYEWWYYCLFALISSLLLRSGTARWVPLVLVLLLAVVLPGKLWLWGLIWCLGFLAFAWMHADTQYPRPGFGSGMLVFIAVLTLSRFIQFTHTVETIASIAKDFARDFLVGLAYVFALVGASRLSRPLALSHFHARLANFSYSLYLCHFPAMIFLVTFLHDTFGFQFRQQPSLFSMAYFLTLTAVLYAYGYAVYVLSERHTARLRQGLTVWFAPGRRGAHA